MAFLGGCGDTPATTLTGPVVRDSAGIRIVEYQQAPKRSRASLVLVWEHGAGTKDHLFQSVFAGALQPDGGAVVADLSTGEVVVIDASGTTATMLATQGEGPDEVLRPERVITAGQDTVWIQDTGNRKLMRFEDGELIAAFSTQGAGPLPPFMIHLGNDSQGRILMASSVFASMNGLTPGNAGSDWIDGYVVVFDSLANFIDTVAVRPLFRQRRAPPYSPFFSLRTIVGAGGGFIYARSDISELTWHDFNGSITQVVRWHQDLVLPTEKHWEDFLVSLREGLALGNPQFKGPDLERLVERSTARLAIDPQTPLPFFGEVDGSPHGDIWLAPYTMAGEPSRYATIISNDGTQFTEVEFPSPVFILAITEHLVLVRAWDEMDVERVAVFRFTIAPA